MKVKIFNTDSGVSSFMTAEQTMNEWLKDKNITIVNMVFNANSSRFVLIIFYTENPTL